MALLIGQLLNGMIVGSLYAIIALGLTLTFGITGIVNFALGEFMLIGAYLTWYFFDGLHLPYPVAVVAAMVVTGLCGYLSDVLLFRHTRNHLINGLLVSVGLTLIIQAAVLYLWTATPQQMSRVIPGSITLLGISLPSMRVVVLAILMAGIAFTYYGLRKTWLGRGAYALAQNADAARLMGVRTGLLQSGIVVYSTVLAGLGGALCAALYTLEPTLGAFYMIKGVVAAIVGGIGSIPGALFGGLLIGVLESLGTTYVLASMRDAYGLLFVILVLVFKPSGLWGRRT